MALAPGFGIELHFDVRRHAVIFDFPGALGGVEGDAGRGDEAAIHQNRIIVNSYEAAPGALADELADADVAEEPGHVIAA